MEKEIQTDENRQTYNSDSFAAYATRQFQQHVKAPAPTPIKVTPPQDKEIVTLATVRAILFGAEKMLEASFRDTNSNAILRLKLIVSETVEMVDAIGANDEVELADALADLLYVVYGAGVAFDLPLDACFSAVHASNMTKGTAAAKHDSNTDKGKGKGYQPPDIADTIKLHRELRSLRWTQQYS